MSPMAAPCRVGVKWDMSLQIRSHLDEFLQCGKTFWAGRWRDFPAAGLALGLQRGWNRGGATCTAFWVVCVHSCSWVWGCVIWWPHQDPLGQWHWEVGWRGGVVGGSTPRPQDSSLSLLTSRQRFGLIHLLEFSVKWGHEQSRTLATKIIY